MRRYSVREKFVKSDDLGERQTREGNFFRCTEDFFFILSTAEAFVRISGNINIMDINICSGYGLNNAEGHRQGLVVCLHGHCGGDSNPMEAYLNSGCDPTQKLSHPEAQLLARPGPGVYDTDQYMASKLVVSLLRQIALSMRQWKGGVNICYLSEATRD